MELRKQFKVSEELYCWVDYGRRTKQFCAQIYNAAGKAQADVYADTVEDLERNIKTAVRSIEGSA